MGFLTPKRIIYFAVEDTKTSHFIQRPNSTVRMHHAFAFPKRASCHNESRVSRDSDNAFEKVLEANGCQMNFSQQ